MIIAKRAASLSKTYLVIGVGLTFVGVLFSSFSGLIGSTTTTGIATGGSSSAAGVPFIGVSFQSLAAILFATPVLMLFVYDKNNGVIEYLLSLGMTQRDIYRQYLKAAIILAAMLVVFDVGADLVVVGLLQGQAVTAMEIAGLTVAVGLTSVSLGTMLMMSFSSLQKQRMGSNQPLGLAIGSLAVWPSYFLPVVIPSAAFTLDLVLACVVGGLALVVFSLSGRLVRREKLLP
jgi:hypothetical protein